MTCEIRKCWVFFTSRNSLAITIDTRCRGREGSFIGSLHLDGHLYDPFQIFQNPILKMCQKKISLSQNVSVRLILLIKY